MKRVHLTAKGLHESKLSEWALRFLFGCCISALAAFAGKKFGPEIGGLFLAFPSILPATLTLIVDHHSREDAAEDSRGAALGSVASVVFAGIAFLALNAFDPWVALGLATAGWMVSAVAIWAFAEW